MHIYYILFEIDCQYFHIYILGLFLAICLVTFYILQYNIWSISSIYSKIVNRHEEIIIQGTYSKKIFFCLFRNAYIGYKTAKIRCEYTECILEIHVAKKG